MTSERPLAVITGASSGIGLELAKLLAERGYDLAVTAEVSDGLQAAAELIRAEGGDIAASVAADLTQFDGVEQVASAVLQLGRPVEVLCLNAGIGVNGLFTETPLEKELRLIALNITSVVHLAKRLIPPMAARGQGRVLITSSIASLMPTPYEACYGGSKAFLRSFSESLRTELKDKGVVVTALMPGPTETNFFDRAGMKDTKIGAGPKDDAAMVARQGLDALLAGKDSVIAGSMKVKAQGVLAKDILPEKVAASMHASRSKPGSAKGSSRDKGNPSGPASNPSRAKKS